MRTREEIILVKSRVAPTVEIDTSVGAAYVRFESEQTTIARSKQIDRAGYPTVTIDYDQKGKLIGVELQGVVEFSVSRLLELAHVQAPNADLGGARYIGAGHSPFNAVPFRA